MSQVLETTYKTATRSTSDFMDEAFDQPLVHTYTQTTKARVVPRRALAGAVFSWLTGVFAICYLILPLFVDAIGLHATSLPNFILNALAFIPMVLFTTLLVAVTQPKVVTSRSAPRDPVIAATVGSLLVWALAHQTSAVLTPITSMPWYEALTFTATNVLESGMIGAMLASFAKTTGRAFALGVAFQTMLLSFFMGWVI